MTGERTIPRPSPTATRPRARLVTALGPAVIAAVAYIDPGNVATNVAAGSRYGHLLVWAVVSASSFAVIVQYLSAKVGLATGRTLPQLCRERFGRRAARLLWIQAECVAAATDVAEVIGGAIALRILFGLPLLAGGLIVSGASLLVLQVQTSRGQRGYELVVGALFTCAVAGFCWLTIAGGPDPAAIAAGMIPRITDHGSEVLVAGIVGATIMPHAVYLHSALVTRRFGTVLAADRRHRLLRATRWDVGVAMTVATAANVALLVAAAEYLRGAPIEDIVQAHAGLRHAAGPVLATLFALALLASGLVSSSVGTHAGAVIMEGFLGRRTPLAVRRLVVLVPALATLASGVDPGEALILTQVILSFGIPFALLPLIVFTRDRRLMGDLVNRRTTTAAAGLGTLAVLAISLFTLVS